MGRIQPASEKEVLKKGTGMLRTELREHIFKMLFQIEFNEAADMPEHVKLYCESLEGATDKDKEYIQKKYEAVVSHVPEIDEIINENAKGWKTSRMNKADLTILRLAVYGMKIFLQAWPLMRRWNSPESSAAAVVLLL